MLWDGVRTKDSDKLCRATLPPVVGRSGMPVCSLWRSLGVAKLSLVCGGRW